MTRKTVPLPNYPKILRQRWKPVRTIGEQIQIFDALCDHYEIIGTAGGTSGRLSQGQLLDLVQKLLRDFVEPYREPKKSGRPPKGISHDDDEIRVYLEAGGANTVIAPSMAESYAQACFVLEMRKLTRTEGTLVKAFASLTGDMPEKKRLRAKLPKRYRNLKSASSFKDAWKAIPAYVRDDPEEWIPSTDAQKSLGKD